MEEEKENLSIDKKGVLKIIIVALVFIALISGILANQYYRITKKQISRLEEKIEEQTEEIQQISARETLERFMEYRIDKNENMADNFLTENAMYQKDKGEFILIYEFENYEILNIQKKGEESYNFTVKIYGKETTNFGEIIEIVTVIKIPKLDRYYVDSVNLAG